MKKTILAIFAIALLVSCKTEKKVDYALLSGKITNPNGPNLFIINGLGEKQKEISVEKDGTFKDTIFNVDGYYNLNDGRETTAIYLKNGYNLTLNLDTKEFDETITYTGEGEKPNNYLAHKFMANEKDLGAPKELYALEEADFLKKVNDFKAGLEDKLKELPNDFKAAEKKVLTYENAIKLSQYEGYHQFLTKKNDFKVSENFPNPTEGISLDNEEDFENIQSYQQLVSNNFFSKIRTKVSETKKPFQEVAIEEIKSIKKGKIQAKLLEFLSSSVRGTSPEDVKLYDAIMELSTDDKLKDKLKKEMEAHKKLAKGNASPTFENYENYKGGTSSLKDFEGKYVYVDVWATWCGPCKREIPFLQKIEKQYHGKNIAFVGISVDRENDKEKWKQMIADKNMSGVQLFADKDWSSNFVRSYGIKGIPRFILIDPKGNIVSANAPRPSDPKLIELFKEVGL